MNESKNVNAVDEMRLSSSNQARRIRQALSGVQRNIPVAGAFVLPALMPQFLGSHQRVFLRFFPFPRNDASGHFFPVH